ncbi:MAG: extracellular solute-binding protein [Christensenellales bacterium]
MKTKRLASFILTIVMLCSLATVFAEGTELRTVTILAPLYRPNSVHSLENRDEYPTWQEMNRQLAARGLTIDFEGVVNEQYETVLNTRLASGNLPDIIATHGYVSDAQAVTYGDNGLFLDIIELFNTYDEDGSILKFWEEEFPDIFGFLSTPEGRIYWVPYMYKFSFITGEEYCATAHTLSVRKDWMDKVGLEWNVNMTVDELYDALVAFREQDVNGNGVADEVVNISIDSFTNGIAQAFGLPATLASVTSRSDKIMCPWYEEGIVDYIAYMKKLYEAGVINTSTIGAGEVGTQLRVENKVALEYSYVAQLWLEGDVVGVEGVEYAPTFLRRSADSDDFIVYREGVVMGYASKWVVTKYAKDLQAVTDLFDYIFTTDYSELLHWGIEGLSFKYDEHGARKLNWMFAEISDIPDFRDSWVGLFLEQALPGVGVLNQFPLDRVIRETTYIGLPVESKDIAATWIYEHHHDMWSEHNTPLLAMITAEETEVLNRVETALSSYSKELLVDLIVGNRPLEKLDEYIEEMKSLGLDEYLQVFQARHDRFVAFKER